MKKAFLASWPLLLAACAMPNTTDDAAQVGAEPSAELDGPGKRVKPKGTKSGCTVKYNLPAGMPATAKLASLRLLSDGRYRALVPGTAIELPADMSYEISWESQNPPARIECTSGADIDLTPRGAVGSLLPMPFSDFGIRYDDGSHTTLSSYLCVTSPCVWRPFDPRESADLGAPAAVWSFSPWSFASRRMPHAGGAAGIPEIPFQGARRLNQILDLATVMATVHLEFDDVDPAYPTLLTGSARARLGADVLPSATSVPSFERFYAQESLSSLPRDFLIPEGSALVLAANADLARLPASKFRAGERTVITFKRLEVEHLVPNGSTLELPGTFSVQPADKSANLFGYSNVPTHSGVDLLPGTYTVTTVAKDAKGMPQKSVDTITL